MNGIAKKNYSELIFLLLQILLYTTFLALDITGGNIRLSMWIKYTVIILCFCYALFAKGAYKSIFLIRNSKMQHIPAHNYQAAGTLLIQIGLFFTLVSDLFILILDYYIYGVLTFILVQQLYGLRLIILSYGQKKESARLSQEGRKHPIFASYGKRLLLQISLVFVISLILYLAGIVLEGLIIVSVFYFICILWNTVTAIGLSARGREDRNNLLYAVGMLLFLLCDINVGLFNLSSFLAISGEIYKVIDSISSILMWTFYAPSQVLIAISSRYNKE